MKKYIIVTGGVCSSLGKGISASAIGSLLESRGLSIQMIKIDPYINVDAGTMSPYQHGEVYVTDDGAETDLDLGNYARFTSAALSRSNSITTGQIYQEVIQREREGRYLGRTVQVIPHITDRIKHRIFAVGEAENVDVTIVEIGGTVGDIESFPFIEAARQMIHELGHQNVISVHVTLVPVLPGDELKTKPTQHSVKEMRAIGIQPDILLCRAPHILDESMCRKIALFTNVDPKAVISAYDVPTIYQVPLAFHEQGADQLIIDRLQLECRKAEVEPWETMVNTLTSAQRKVRIAVVGKYIDLQDSYKSVDEALYHGGIAQSSQVELVKIDSEKLEKESDIGSVFAGITGILVPGGFGGRGIMGMIQTAHYARTNNVPYMGICLGMQIMVIEYARSVLGLTEADSSEFAPDCSDQVISLLEDQVDIQNYGGTMRLGSNQSLLKEGSLIRKAYGKEVISERHRHRYEVSNSYRDVLSAAGLIIGGTTMDGKLVESVQWPDHSWGVGVQFHPEFKSQPTNPHPLFSDFVAAAVQAVKLERKK